MTRKEALVLVSRALSVLSGISAAYETSYLPERLLSFFHYREIGGEYLRELYGLTMAILFLRIALYVFLAFLFWKCGPWVERTLLPDFVEEDRSAKGSENVE
jgi:hypothetical protein